MNRKPLNYWSEQNIKIEIEKIILQTNRFPSSSELRNSNRMDLAGAIAKHGGFNKFRNILGYEYLVKPKGYWSKDNTIQHLREFIIKIGKFPLQKDFKIHDMNDLLGGIHINGGLSKIGKEIGYKQNKCPLDYWTENNVIEELNEIIILLNHFPTQNDIISMRKRSLLNGIYKHGGLSKFCTLMGYNLSSKPKGYWTEENTIKELKIFVSEIGYFPTEEIFKLNGKLHLYNMMSFMGGINKYRTFLGCDILKNEKGYWNDTTIVNELNNIINSIMHFPSKYEVDIFNTSLSSGINQNGGLIKYRELCGYPSLIFDEYRRELTSYCVKRGKKTEKLLYNILNRYCIEKELSSPRKNIKLSKGNIIEFICESNRSIGIDVTNTRTGCNIHKKWTKKDYHKYLDELWIIVFSNEFTDEDYKRWNNKSPDNVYIYNIDDFIEELQLDLDEYTKNKIENYKSCTFHTRDKFKEQSVKT